MAGWRHQYIYLSVGYYTKRIPMFGQSNYVFCTVIMNLPIILSMNIHINQWWPIYYHSMTTCHELDILTFKNTGPGWLNELGSWIT
jgi:hypothetical protein